MENKILCVDAAVCSSWGRKIPKHIFRTQYAPNRGHKFCLNCGLTLGEARKEEKFNHANEIETRIVDFHSDLDNPIYLSAQDLKQGNYKVFI